MNIEITNLTATINQNEIIELAKKHLSNLASNYESARRAYYAIVNEGSMSYDARKQAAYELCQKTAAIKENAEDAYRAIGLGGSLGIYDF